MKPCHGVVDGQVAFGHYVGSGPVSETDTTCPGSTEVDSSTCSSDDRVVSIPGLGRAPATTGPIVIDDSQPPPPTVAPKDFEPLIPVHMPSRMVGSPPPTILPDDPTPKGPLDPDSDGQAASV